MINNMRMTLSNSMIITRREVRDSFRDWRILTPIILLTFIFPFFAQMVAARFAGWLSGYGAEIIGERTIPFLLMIVGFFPISISLVIALETFVGEKERRSLEPLLSTPLTNSELYIGKTLSAMIPPLVTSLGGMMVYLLTLLGGELAWRPQPMLIVQIILLTIVQALVMVTGAVVVSSQTTSTRAANLLASFIIIPMTLVVNGESIIMFLAPDANSPNGIGALWAIIFGMFIVSILLLRVGNSVFNREELLASTIDQMNLRGIFSKIKRYVRAVDDSGTPAKNIIDWYRFGVLPSLARFKTAILITTVIFVLAFGVGFGISQIERWQLPLPPQSELLESTNRIRGFINASAQQEAMSFIIWQNGRVVLGIFLLSIFTFGVGALAIAPITFALVGYIVGLTLSAGYDPFFIIGGIMTHGIIEIPMLIFATGASLALGAVITRPPKNHSVGHTWIVTLSHAIKVGIGLIIPMLIVAAFIEAYITPDVVLWILER